MSEMEGMHTHKPSICSPLISSINFDPLTPSLSLSLSSYYRALKTKGNTPKYGLIFHSSFIGRAGSKNKGRISRYLANKCSIASRIDCFSGSVWYYYYAYILDLFLRVLNSSGECSTKVCHVA